LFTALDLKWPHVSSEILKNTQMLEAILRLVEAKGDEEAEKKIVKEYGHLPMIKVLQEDRELILTWRTIEDIQESAASN
jgi:hypothetical protein